MVRWSDGSSPARAGTGRLMGVAVGAGVGVGGGGVAVGAGSVGGGANGDEVGTLGARVVLAASGAPNAQAAVHGAAAVSERAARRLIGRA